MTEVPPVRAGDAPTADDAHQTPDVPPVHDAPEPSGAQDAGLEPGAETGPESTGNERVDQALARLTELPARPTSEHADVYEDVHRRLHAALTELDDD